MCSEQTLIAVSVVADRCGGSRRLLNRVPLRGSLPSTVLRPSLKPSDERERRRGSSGCRSLDGVPLTQCQSARAALGFAMAGSGPRCMPSRTCRRRSRGIAGRWARWGGSGRIPWRLRALPQAGWLGDLPLAPRRRAVHLSYAPYAPPYAPKTLYRMKKDTVRPIDQADARALRAAFDLGQEE
jgi:hypothetical protein